MCPGSAAHRSIDVGPAARHGLKLEPRYDPTGYTPHTPSARQPLRDVYAPLAIAWLRMWGEERRRERRAGGLHPYTLGVGPCRNLDHFCVAVPFAMAWSIVALSRNLAYHEPQLQERDGVHLVAQRLEPVSRTPGIPGRDS